LSAAWELRFVDRDGRTSASLSVDALARLTHGRGITLRRSDLAATIYGALDGTVETIFGDPVASIEEAGACVRVGAGDAAYVRPVSAVKLRAIMSAIWSTSPQGERWPRSWAAPRRREGLERAQERL
jgi:hypothetical protein